MSKKTVLKLEIHCERCKKRVLKAAAGVEGVDSVAIDMKEKKLTVIGDADPVFLATKLRKFGSTEVLTVGPAKEEKKDEKKPESKPAEPKKNEPKKDEQKKEPPAIVYVYPAGNPTSQGYYCLSDENPNACSIS